MLRAGGSDCQNPQTRPRGWTGGKRIRAFNLEARHLQQFEESFFSKGSVPQLQPDDRVAPAGFGDNEVKQSIGTQECGHIPQSSVRVITMLDHMRGQDKVERLKVGLAEPAQVAAPFHDALGLLRPS